MITWKEAAVESRIPGDGLSMERNHHPPAEQERSPVDRIDIDDEDRDGVSMWEWEKKNPVHLSQHCCCLLQHCCYFLHSLCYLSINQETLSIQKSCSIRPELGLIWLENYVFFFLQQAHLTVILFFFLLYTMESLYKPLCYMAFEFIEIMLHSMYYFFRQSVRI